MSKLGYGGLTAGIGMLIVFVGLTILVFCITVMGAIFKSIDRKKADKEAAAKAAAAPVVEAPAPAPVAEEIAEAEEAPAEDDAQLIAVIAAAIAAYDNSGKRLAVRKVRRVPSWNNAAREEQVYHL